MEAFVITWHELLIAGILIVGIYAIELLMLLRSTKKSKANPQDDEIKELRSMAADAEQHITRLSAEVDQLKEEVAQVRAALLAANTPYSQAIELAREGLDVVDVASRCGISRGEAELIVALHREARPE